MHLNKEQEKISYTKPSGPMLVKGIAGSGKTTVGVYRIPFLLNNYCFEPDDSILLMTYNKTLVNYMGYLYGKIEKEYKKNYPTLFELPRDRIKITTIDGLIYPYYLKSCKKNDKKYSTNISNSEKFSIIGEYIEKLSKEYEDMSLFSQDNLKFLYDEIEWIKSCNYIEGEYQNADRVGATKYDEHSHRLPKNSKIRKAIYNLMELYSEELLKRNYVDFNDVRRIALETMDECSVNKFTHIIIDESQDLSKLQLELLKKVYNEKEYSSITFLFDCAQSIYSQSWLGNGRNFTTIGFNMAGRSKTLSKNFRTTTQISQAAYSLLEKSHNIVDDENYVKPYLIDRQGDYPVYRHFLSESQEMDYLVNLIKNELSDYKMNEIVVVGRSRLQLENARQIMKDNSIQCEILDRDNSDFEKDAVRLMTMHSIKGIESKVVILINVNEGVVPFYSSKDEKIREFEAVTEKKLFYVGMTRATETLYITSSIKPSKFISEIKSKYLRFDKKSRIRGIYNISLEEYRFKEKLINLYFPEEKVRQWVINELINNYKYPQELIEIEHPVIMGSKKGFVDIAVSRYENGKKKTFIYIEVKSMQNGIESGRNQILSYASVSKDVEYCMVTDGIAFEVFDSSGEKKEDIPIFEMDMMPSKADMNTAFDLEKSRELIIFRDDDGSMEVDFGNISERYSYEYVMSLPIYGKILGDIPVFMNSEENESFYLPKELVKDKNGFFLRVRGDSMKNAGIEDGDLVLLRQDLDPKSGDIIAVAIDGEATLKRLMKMRNSIILLPENPDYEEIYINEQDVNLLGTASIVIRKNRSGSSSSF
ncbi:S24 family peptidase [uncultured Ilyobacter sp.]|uniref:S24 family peptidase n=1 Tax=uncultured Ilyobacter sp. TaxID=544433 RepID=UPI0029C972AC|nr:S24 family peptidase [uncultured Ilyobacter sp.]